MNLRKRFIIGMSIGGVILVVCLILFLFRIPKSIHIQSNKASVTAYVNKKTHTVGSFLHAIIQFDKKQSYKIAIQYEVDGRVYDGYIYDIKDYKIQYDNTMTIYFAADNPKWVTGYKNPILIDVANFFSHIILVLFIFMITLPGKEVMKNNEKYSKIAIRLILSIFIIFAIRIFLEVHA